jgi:hypothetical protein
VPSRAAASIRRILPAAFDPEFAGRSGVILEGVLLSRIHDRKGEMARQLAAPPDQVRVIFRTTEAERFLRGWEPAPNRGGTDPLNRALQQSLTALESAFPGAGEHVEILIRPAPWVGDPGHEWYAVDFGVPHEEVREAGHDPEVVSDWIAEFTPDLVFALENESGRPVRMPDARSAVPDRRASPYCG